MAKRKKSTSASEANEVDSVFFLKMVLYMIIGSLWLKVSTKNALQFPLPIGLIVGLLFASHEHFRIDRKIEYAIMLLAMFIGFWLPFRIYIVR